MPTTARPTTARPTTARPTTARRMTTRVVPVVVATTLVGVLTACGGTEAPSIATAQTAATPSSSSRAVDREQLARRYISCMRENSVAMLDELTSEGIPQVDKTASSAAEIESATRKCQQFHPPAEQAEAVAPEDVERMRRYAACLRTHGLPDYPDPDPETGSPALSDELAAQLKTDPDMPNAERACSDLSPASAGDGIVGG